jgi:hypothetical protein
MIAEEAATLADEALEAGRLDAAEFTRWWWQLVRRIVLGDVARNNNCVTDDLWRLRKSGNWSFLGLSHARLRERFFDRLYTYAEDADPHSLIGTLAQLPAHGSVGAVGQVPHWLFAFDAAGMAALRAVAILATHPEERSRCETGELEQLKLRPFLRACVLESVRLWPTTSAILRELTADTTFGEGARFASGSSVIATPAFQRDPDLLPFANDFVPDIWVDGRPEQYPQLVPFSAGPAECPGRNLVLFVTSTVIAHLLSMMRLELQTTPLLDRHRPCRPRSISSVWCFGPPRRPLRFSTVDLVSSAGRPTPSAGVPEVITCARNRLGAGRLYGRDLRRPRRPQAAGIGHPLRWSVDDHNFRVIRRMHGAARRPLHICRRDNARAPGADGSALTPVSRRPTGTVAPSRLAARGPSSTG